MIFFSSFLTPELFFYQLFHAFLFFHASALLPSGSTNPWPLQTGSMRVRGQTSVACFYLLFYYIPVFSFSISLRLSPPLSLPCWKTVNLELSSHQLQSALPCSACSSTQDTSLPPVSSSPPLLLPHLVLSVKLPLPVSHVLVPSSCCDLHLRGCSRQCSAYDVAHMLWPPRLSGVSIVQSIPLDVCAVAVIDATCYKIMCQTWQLMAWQKDTEATFWGLFPQTNEIFTMSGCFYSVVLALLWALFRQYCTSGHSKKLHFKWKYSCWETAPWLMHYYILNC